MCQCPERRLPELPRRAGAPATARAQDRRRGFEIRRLRAQPRRNSRLKWRLCNSEMSETKMHNDPIAIVSAARTPIGGLQGDFATLSGTSAASFAEGGLAARHGLHDSQQDVRLGDGGRDAGARCAHRRQRRHHRRRWHGEHDQCSVPASQGSRRNAHGSRHSLRSHVSRRPRGRLRQGQADGRVCGSMRRQVSIHPRATRRIRAALAIARARRD